MHWVGLCCERPNWVVWVCIKFVFQYSIFIICHTRNIFSSGDQHEVFSKQYIRRVEWTLHAVTFNSQQSLRNHCCVWDWNSCRLISCDRLALLGQKKKNCCVALIHAQNWKIGSVGRFFFFFYIYTYVCIYTHTQFLMEKMNAVRMHLKVLFKAIFS